MNRKILRVGAVFMGIMTLFSLLTGCIKKGGNNGGKDVSENTGTVVLNEGAVLTGLYMSHQGMAMEPQYIFRVTETGNFMKITNTEPNDFMMTENGEAKSGAKPAYPLNDETEARYFGFIDEVKKCEHASLVKADEATIQELYDTIIESGALSWDGYSKHVSMENVEDSGDGYDLFLQFSDGSTVKVNSYNSHPKGWGDFFVKVRDIFEAHEDYSQYVIQELTEEDCERLIVEFGDARINPDTLFKVDICVRENLGTWSWSLRIKDKDGRYLEKDTDISLYKEESLDTLSYGRIIEVLRKHEIQKWHGIEGTATEGRKYMSVLIADKGDKSISANANGNLLPEDYDEVRDDFAKALIEFYEGKK